MDDKAPAKRYGHRVEGLRHLAKQVHDPLVRDRLLDIVAQYEHMATDPGPAATKKVA